MTQMRSADSPKLSVLMSVYNGENFLPMTLESILGQTWTDYEFIIADDGSTDNTWNVLSAYASRDMRIRLVRHPQNFGVTRSMNAIFSLATGDYVVRHDADDLSLPARFALQIDYLNAHPEIGVLGSWVENIDASGQPYKVPSFFPADIDNETIQTQLLSSNCLGQGAVMFRRTLLDKTGHYDESLDYCEDYDLWLRMAEITRIAKLPVTLYQYRQHESAVSRIHYCVQMRRQAETLEKAICRRHGPHPDPSRFRQTIHHYIEAGSAYLAAGEAEAAYNCLARAIVLGPDMFVRDDFSTPLQLTGSGQTTIDAVFSRLPPGYQAIRARLISRLHMREVFDGYSQADFDRVSMHLWPALRYDPTWYLNPGVISIARKTLWRRIFGKPVPSKPAASKNPPPGF
jgi:GT2 family glycosyltransferase